MKWTSTYDSRPDVEKWYAVDDANIFMLAAGCQDKGSQKSYGWWMIGRSGGGKILAAGTTVADYHQAQRACTTAYHHLLMAMIDKAEGLVDDGDKKLKEEAGMKWKLDDRSRIGEELWHAASVGGTFYLTAGCRRSVSKPDDVWWRVGTAGGASIMVGRRANIDQAKKACAAKYYQLVKTLTDDAKGFADVVVVDDDETIKQCGGADDIVENGDDEQEGRTMTKGKMSWPEVFENEIEVAWECTKDGKVCVAGIEDMNLDLHVEEKQSKHGTHCWCEWSYGKWAGEEETMVAARKVVKDVAHAHVKNILAGLTKLNGDDEEHE